ncbi:hypothetical protein PAPHI01_1076 [Pancytospora philotis]|nr:hypothetical protein PAPHI01_1076 [Pancytospora philotis]
MNVAENKRKPIPGSRDIILQIRSLSNSIQALDTEIKDSYDLMGKANRQARENSKMGEVSASLRVANDELKGLRNEKHALLADMNDAKNQLIVLRETTTKDKTNVSYRNPEDIDKKIEELNMRLITETIMPKEEKQIAADLLNLRSMKCKLGDIEDSFTKIKRLEASLREVRDKLTEISKIIAEKTTARDQIKAELDAIADVEKAKSPAVAQYETKIAALKQQKQDLLDKKTNKKKEIETLEAEWAKFEVVLNEQQDLEDKKYKIKKRIGELRDKKDLMLNEVHSFNPKIFDTLHYTVSQLKKSAVFSIDISLVDQLMKHGVKVPSNASELDEVLAQLDDKKSNSASVFKNRSDSVGKDIAELNAAIEAESAKLAELPPTDYDILKKGGRIRTPRE